MWDSVAPAFIGLLKWGMSRYGVGFLFGIFGVVSIGVMVYDLRVRAMEYKQLQIQTNQAIQSLFLLYNNEVNH